MRKRIRFKSLLLDLFVLLLCLSLAGGGAYLFWKDLNSSSVRSDKECIATLSYKYRISQRKYQDRAVWERLSQNSPLYNGDIIRTAELASAVIHFDDGTDLNLSENTMVQIFYDEENGLQITVDGGDIQVDSSSQSTAVSVRLDDGSVVNVGAGSSLAAKADASGSRNVEVKSGIASLMTEDGQTTSLLNGESVSIENGGEVVRNPITVTSIPRDMRLLNIEGQKRPVTLVWRASSDAGAENGVIVQTSLSKDFAEILTEQTVTDASSCTLTTPESGLLYWRVFTSQAEDKASEGKITVQKVSALNATSPADSGEIRYRSASPRVMFRWEGNSFAEYYRVTVSSAPDLSAAPLTFDTTDTFVSVDSLTDGTWYWQVSPYYPNGIAFAGESPIYSFSITKNVVIASPSLTIPADKATISYRDTISTTFMWKSELRDASYQLLIARDSSFANLVYDETTSALRLQKDFTPSELPDGTYWWKVIRSSSNSDDLTPESEARQFTIAQYVPQQNKLTYPADGARLEQDKMAAVKFSWKLGDDYKNVKAQSVIQISRSENFNTLVMERSTDSLTLDGLQLEEGTYWWRLGARLASGSVEGFTAANRFTVLGQLLPPMVTTPASGGEMLYTGSTPLEFKWTEVKGADYYNVRVYDVDDNLVAQNASVKENSAQFALPTGKYVLKVQSVIAATEADAARQSDFTNRSFTVRQPDAITLVSPAARGRIEGLTAIREPTVFTWAPGKDSASSYQFVLSRQNTDGSLRVVEQKTVTGTSVSISRITPGTYSWRVNATASGGYAIDSAPSQLTVTAIPPLPKPQLSSPVHNTVLGATYFKNNRSISFSWKAVAGATSYTFVLYKVNANGTRVAVQTNRRLNATSVQVTDLTKLDVGTFVWEVTAYAHASDGYEERRSESSSATLKIDFTAPQQVETVDPGRLYGE